MAVDYKPLDLVLYIVSFGFLLVSINVFVNFAKKRNRDKKNKKLRIKSDKFYSDHGYSYDYVFIFKVYVEDEIGSLNASQEQFTMKNIIDRCKLSQIETKCYYSCRRDAIFVKMRVSLSRLLAQADFVKYIMLLDPKRLQLAAQTGLVVKENNRNIVVWKPVYVTDEHHISPFEVGIG